MMMVGDRGAVRFVVDDESTAIALGSGDVPVLGTPKVVALIEAAAVSAVASELPFGATTVGTHISVDHVAPTRVGAIIEAEAILVAQDGRRITFEASVREGADVVATGTHTRVVVERDRFLG